MAQHQILSVSALTRAIKGNVEHAFPFVWVRGQVTNVARPSSGHVYFSLRDENATIAAVWFKRQHTAGTHFDPLTGEVYEEGPKQSLATTLTNGQEIICAGKLTVYEPRGNYQLIVELAEDAGLGRLQAEFERLKGKLAQEGYFALNRKRPLPPSPSSVAIITSPKGAAVHDFLRIAQARGAGATLKIYPVAVQGEFAPAQIVRAIQQVCKENTAQVIVLIRGGGSLEDLHAFNTEAVAKAVFDASIPVLAGIGHEVDFTLADLTADVRAATPTHAAQMLWAEKKELLQKIAQYNRTLDYVYASQLARQRQQVQNLADALDWLTPAQRLTAWNQRLTYLTEQLAKSSSAALRNKTSQLYAMHIALQRSPLERVTHSKQQLRSLEASLTQGVLQGVGAKQQQLAIAAYALTKMPPALQRNATTLAKNTAQLTYLGNKHLMQAAHTLEMLTLQLESVNPLAPLSRGYALVAAKSGKFILSAHQVATGDNLTITLHDGAVSVNVTGVTPNE